MSKCHRGRALKWGIESSSKMLIMDYGKQKVKFVWELGEQGKGRNTGNVI